MVRVNTLSLFYGLVIYCIKAVSSIALDLNDLDVSNFYITKIIDYPVTKIMILSTPENKITEVHTGKFVIWSPLEGEYVKCVTLFKFNFTKKKLCTIEIENPRKTDMLYLHKYYSQYNYITKKEFEKEYGSTVMICNELDRPKKRGRPRKQKPETETEGLEPETIRVEIESDDEEPLDLSIKQKPETEQTPLYKFTLEPEAIHLEISSDEESTELEPENIHLEISSDEEENKSEISDIDLLFSSDDEEPLDLSIKQKPETEQTQYIEPEKIETEELEPEAIAMEIESDSEDE